MTDCVHSRSVHEVFVVREKEAVYEAARARVENRFGVHVRKRSSKLAGEPYFSVDVEGSPESVDAAVKYITTCIFPPHEHAYSYSSLMDKVFASPTFIEDLEKKYDCVVLKVVGMEVLKLFGDEIDVTSAVSHLEKISQDFFATVITDSNASSAPSLPPRPNNHVNEEVYREEGASAVMMMMQVHTGDIAISPGSPGEVAMDEAAGGRSHSTNSESDDVPVLDEFQKSVLRSIAETDIDEALRQYGLIKNENYFDEYGACSLETKKDLFQWLLDRSLSVERCSRAIKRERQLAELEGARRSSVCDDDSPTLDSPEGEFQQNSFVDAAEYLDPVERDRIEQDRLFAEALQSEENSRFLSSDDANRRVISNQQAKQITIEASNSTPKSKATRKKERKLEQQKAAPNFAGVVGLPPVANAGVNHNVNPSTNLSQAANSKPNQPRSGFNQRVQPVNSAAAELDTGGYLRPVIIDGNNVAREHGRLSKVFSSRGICIAVDYFKQRGHRDIVVYVPQWRPFGNRAIPPTVDGHLLVDLHDQGLLEYSPSRKNPVTGLLEATYDDWYIVNAAYLKDGVIVSNDQFRDVIATHPQFTTTVAERKLPFNFLGDTFIVPPDPRGRYGPSLDEILRKSAPTAGPSSVFNSAQLPSQPPMPMQMYPGEVSHGYGYPYGYGGVMQNGVMTSEAYGPSVQQYGPTAADNVPGWPSQQYGRRAAEVSYDQPYGRPVGFGNSFSAAPSNGFQSHSNVYPVGAASTKARKAIIINQHDFVANSDEENRQVAEAMRLSCADGGISTQPRQTTLRGAFGDTGAVQSNGEEEGYVDISGLPRPASTSQLQRSQKP